jgi:hypothetical protein
VHPVHPASERLDPRRGLARITAAEQRDVRSGLGKAEGGALAEPSVRAGHQRDLAVEPETVEDHEALPRAR